MDRSPPLAPPALTRLQQLLLGTDGTVTHLLSVFAGEPIDVVKLAQVFDRATPSDDALDVAAGDRVLRRQVLLRGRESGTDFLHADAVVVPARVDAAVLDGLLATDEPIGRLLATNRVETFREILSVGQAPAGPCGRHFRIPETADVVFRTYRIVTMGLPAMLITERFPPGSFLTLPA
jgi:chorismate-pyruvate lyase